MYNYINTDIIPISTYLLIWIQNVLFRFGTQQIMFGYCKENPHLPQNEELGGFDVPHFEQTDARAFPQLLQNFELFRFCKPQLGQVIPLRALREDWVSNFVNGSYIVFFIDLIK